MAPIAARILSEVLGLPAGGRGEIAAKLLDSLDPDTDTDADAAWDQEIRDRLDEVRSGRVAPVTWAEARKQILDDTDGDRG